MIIRKFENKFLKNSIEIILFSCLISFCFMMSIHPEIARKISIFGFCILVFVINYKELYTIFKTSLFLKTIFLFILFCILSYFWSDDYQELKKNIRVILRYLIIPTVFLISLINKYNLKFTIISFLCGMIVNITISYLMFFFNLKELFSFSLSPFNLVPFQASYMEYSLYVTITSILLLYYFLKSKEKILRIILLSLSMISIVLLFLLEGRTGQLSFIITLLLLTIIYSKKYIQIIISFISIIIILFCAYLFSNTFKIRIDTGLNDLIEITNSNYNTSLGVRLSSYKIIPEIIKSTNLLIGTGIGDSKNIINEINKEIYYDSFNEQKGLLHQSFLTIFHSLGLIGLTLFIFSLYNLYSLKIEEDSINFVKYVFIISLIVDLMTNEFFKQREILLLFSFFSSIIVITKIEEIKSNNIH